MIAIDQSRGITLRLKGRRAGGTYHLLPDLRAFDSAPPAYYRLRESGETVIDPDFTATRDVLSPNS